MLESSHTKYTLIDPFSKRSTKGKPFKPDSGKNKGVTVHQACMGNHALHSAITLELWSVVRFNA